MDIAFGSIFIDIYYSFREEAIYKLENPKLSYAYRDCRGFAVWDGI